MDLVRIGYNGRYYKAGNIGPASCITSAPAVAPQRRRFECQPPSGPVCRDRIEGMRNRHGLPPGGTHLAGTVGRVDRRLPLPLILGFICWASGCSERTSPSATGWSDLAHPPAAGFGLGALSKQTHQRIAPKALWCGASGRGDERPVGRRALKLFVLRGTVVELLREEGWQQVSSSMAIRVVKPPPSGHLTLHRRIRPL